MNQLDQAKISDRKIKADRDFIQPELITGTEWGVVPTHLVGDLKEFPHISLQRPTTLSQATQPIPSLRHRFGPVFCHNILKTTGPLRFTPRRDPSHTWSVRHCANSPGWRPQGIPPHISPKADHPVAGNTAYPQPQTSVWSGLLSQHRLGDTEVSG